MEFGAWDFFKTKIYLRNISYLFIFAQSKKQGNESNMKKLFSFQIIFFFIGNIIYAQNDTIKTDSLRKDALKIFIDCNYCDKDFIRNEITFVNYVRDSKEAQLHILITEQYTGSGGKEYSLFFIGQKEFNNMYDTLKFYTKVDDTDDEIRQNLVKILKIGLMRYAAKTPLYDKISINVVNPRFGN